MTVTLFSYVFLTWRSSMLDTTSSPLPRLAPPRRTRRDCAMSARVVRRAALPGGRPMRGLVRRMSSGTMGPLDACRLVIGLVQSAPARCVASSNCWGAVLWEGNGETHAEGSISSWGQPNAARFRKRLAGRVKELQAIETRPASRLSCLPAFRSGCSERGWTARARAGAAASANGNQRIRTARTDTGAPIWRKRIGSSGLSLGQKSGRIDESSRASARRPFGGVAERLNAAVLKTVGRLVRLESSNLSSSARKDVRPRRKTRWGRFIERVSRSFASTVHPSPLPRSRPGPLSGLAPALCPASLRPFAWLLPVFALAFSGPFWALSQHLGLPCLIFTSVKLILGAPQVAGSYGLRKSAGQGLPKKTRYSDDPKKALHSRKNNTRGTPEIATGRPKRSERGVTGRKSSGLAENGGQSPRSVQAPDIDAPSGAPPHARACERAQSARQCTRTQGPQQLQGRGTRAP